MLSKIKLSKLEYVFNVCFLFLYIFQPFVCKVSTIVILDIWLLLVIMLHIGGKPKFVITINGSVWKCILGFLPFFIYYVTEMILRAFVLEDNHFSLYLYNIMIVFLILIRIVMVTWYLSILLIDKKYTLDKIIKMFIYTAILQVCFVMLAFKLPFVRSFFNDMTIKYSNSIYVVRALELDTYRSYGFSGNLFDSFGYKTALLIIIAFAYAVDRKKATGIILSIFMFIMPLLNARTGVYLGILGMTIVILMYLKKITGEAVLKGIFLTLFVMVMLMLLLNALPEETKKWIYRGMEATILLIQKGEHTGVYEVLLDSNWIMPPDILFGAGGTPEQIITRGIESGYVNCIWQYGIIGSVLLFGGYANVFFRAYRSSIDRFKKSIAISFLLIFFTYLIKLFSLYNTGANIIILGIPLVLMIDEGQNNKEYRVKGV